MLNVTWTAKSKAGKVGRYQISDILWFKFAAFLNLIGERKLMYARDIDSVTCA